MTESRVEAVARAMCHADGIRFDDLGRVGRDYWLKLAKAAIEASDAWLKARSGSIDITGMEQSPIRMVGNTIEPNPLENEEPDK